MRVIELSNHPKRQLQQTRRRNAAPAGRAQQAAAGLTRHDQAVRAAARVRDSARAERRWGAWLRGILAVWRLRRQAPLPPAPARRVSDEEAQQAAGVAGEELAVTGLGQILSDEWVLLHGYRNRRGEIDLVVVGPGGLAAVEVKYHNALVTCDGDTWWETRDGPGRLRRREQVTDAGGRSPSVQLAEPARMLEEFLRRRGHQVAFQLIVLLNHPRARIGSCTRPTVRMTTSARGVLQVLRSAGQPVPPEEVEQLVELIQRDHAYHQAHRRQ